MRRILAALPLGALLLGAVFVGGSPGPASAGGPGPRAPDAPVLSGVLRPALAGTSAGRHAGGGAAEAPFRSALDRPAPEVRITGTVRSDAGTPGDAADDVGLGGVTVTATPVRGTTPVIVETDAAGVYVIAGLPPGAVDLAFSRAGFSDGGARAVATTPSGGTLDALLSPLP